jgi:aryl sulfotransferase
MNMTAIRYPKKTREMHNHHMDSTFWNDFKFRDDDIIIASFGKSGTTWTQQIVSQLIFNGEEGLNVSDMSPWLDLRVPPREVKLPMIEAQKHRRFLKTHLEVDALVFSPKAKYIYVARDGRDVLWSLYNHYFNANELFYQAINETPGLVGPPVEKPTGSVRDFFLEWLDRDGYPFWSFWDNTISWWNTRHLPNVMLLHFNDLKADLPGEIRRMAAFLEIPIDESKWEAIVEHCTFDYMKKNAALSAPMGGALWEGGAETFINKGQNGRWKDVLTAEDNKGYEETAVARLGKDCARWLAIGEMPA